MKATYYFLGLATIASVVIAACGGSGDSASSGSTVSKGTRVALTPAEKKTLDANLAVGQSAGTKVGNKVNTKMNSSSAASGFLSDFGVASIVWGAATASSSFSENSIQDPKINEDFNFEVPCDGDARTSGTIKVSGNFKFEVNQAAKTGVFATSVSGNASQCMKKDAKVTGPMSVTLQADLAEKSAKITFSLNGSTSTNFSTDGKAADHTLSFNKLSAVINLDERNSQKIDAISKEEDAALTPADKKVAMKKGFQLLSEITECSGSAVIDQRELTCKDLLFTAVSEAIDELDSSPTPAPTPGTQTSEN
jgi:hypothetical protein